MPHGTGTVSDPPADGGGPGRRAVRGARVARSVRRHRTGFTVLGGSTDAAGGGGTAGDTDRRAVVTDGLSVAGLRLVDDSLVLKFEHGDAVGQLAIEPGSGFGPYDGVLAQHDLLADQRTFVPHLRDTRALAVGDPPSAGQGCGDADLLTAVAGLAARKSQRQIALEICGAASSAAQDWDPDGDVRAQVRRLVRKARWLMQGGYLELAAGRRPCL